MKQSRGERVMGKKKSPPVRGRGLKHNNVIQGWSHAQSPPVRGRGLKHCEVMRQRTHKLVAPRAGAWIETNISH